MDYNRYGRERSPNVSSHMFQRSERLDRDFTDRYSDVSRRRMQSFDRLDRNRSRDSDVSRRHLKRFERDSGLRDPEFGESNRHSHRDRHKIDRDLSFRQFDHEYFQDRNCHFDRQNPDVEPFDVPPAPAWPSDKLPSKTKSKKDDVVQIQRKAKQIKSLRKKEERILEHLASKARTLQQQLKKTAKRAEFKNCRIYYIMDTNVTGGKIPINHRDLLLDTWNKLINESEQDSDENFIGRAQFVGGYLEIKLIRADSLPILETIAAKLPILYPDANLRLIPSEQRRATMYLSKGTISKSNAEILQIIAAQNAVCTDQWVIHYRTELEEKDFLVMKIDHKSALEFPTGGEKLVFEKSFATIKLSPNHLASATKPTKKEMKYLMQVSVPKTKQERKEILESMNHQ